MGRGERRKKLSYPVLLRSHISYIVSIFRALNKEVETLIRFFLFLGFVTDN